jgi:hypothetical protein
MKDHNFIWHIPLDDLSKTFCGLDIPPVIRTLASSSIQDQRNRKVMEMREDEPGTSQCEKCLREYERSNL